MVFVHRKVTFCTVILNTVFRPGMNQLSDSEFKDLEKNKAFLSEINCGNMLIGGKHESETTNAVESKSMAEKGAKLAQELKSLSVGEAGKAIAQISDVATLRALGDLDARKGIQELVDKRVNSIKKQEGSDLTPVSIPAPEGTGEEFVGGPEVITKESLEGTETKSSIPALKV